MELDNKPLASEKEIILPSIFNNTTLCSIRQSLTDYKIIKEIGKGASGIVYKAQSYKDNAIYALKKINKKYIQKKKDNDLLKEFHFLKSLKHPNILECYGCFVDSEHLFIVTEYAEYGDLRRIIKNQIERSKRIAECEIWNIIWQIALGLLHLHSHNIIHRDVKTLNILVTKNRRVKIGDLGESIFVDKSKASKSKLHI